jgi:hypothetical protein
MSGVIVFDELEQSWAGEEEEVKCGIEERLEHVSCERLREEEDEL